MPSSSWFLPFTAVGRPVHSFDERTAFHALRPHTRKTIDGTASQYIKILDLFIQRTGRGARGYTERHRGLGDAAGQGFAARQRRARLEADRCPRAQRAASAL